MSGGAFTTKPVYNADLLDNKDSTEFMDATASNTEDWNTASVFGLYFGTDALNSPSTGRFFGRVTIDEVTNDVIQELIATDLSSIWVRKKHNGVWSAYTKLYPFSIASSGTSTNIWVV